MHKSIKEANLVSEGKLRADYSKNERAYDEKLKEYDQEVEDNLRDKMKAESLKDETHNELTHIAEEHK